MTSSTPNSVRNIQRKWTLPNRLEAVAQAGREVFDWLADLPLSSRAKYAAGLAVEEMATNIVKYGYDDDNEHLIHVTIDITRDHIIIEFVDDGHAFDPTKQPAPDIEKLVHSQKAGGLGIELVRRISEKMMYQRDDNLNRLTLHIRRLEPDDTQYIKLSQLAQETP